LRAAVTKLSRLTRCLRVPANAAGRDWVVGDLHGHRSVFERQLERVAFDPRRDRVFSVGDLIDRGPESLEALSLIEEPWFFAVLGNHEMMLLDYLGYYKSRVYSRKVFARGGGQWIGQAIADRRKTLLRLAERLAALPLAIHVEAENAFNVMHGDLLPFGGGACALFDEPTVCVHDVDRATSSRLNIAQASGLATDALHYGEHSVRITESPFGELPVTYVGHSPVRHVTVHRSYVYIEQGVCARPEKQDTARGPTVLEHAGFSQWLKGVVAARSFVAPTDTLSSPTPLRNATRAT